MRVMLKNNKRVDTCFSWMLRKATGMCCQVLEVVSFFILSGQKNAYHRGFFSGSVSLPSTACMSCSFTLFWEDGYLVLYNSRVHW